MTRNASGTLKNFEGVTVRNEHKFYNISKSTRKRCEPVSETFQKIQSFFARLLLHNFTGSNFNFKTCIVNRSLCQLAQREKNLNLGPIFLTFFRCLICVQLLNSKILDRKVPNILRTRLKFEGRLKYSFLGIF